MEIEHCQFPDELLYDPENNTWVRLVAKDDVTIGVASILSAIAGRFTQIRLKTAGTTIQRGQSLGTLESLKFVGPVPSPVTGVIKATNEMVAGNPKLLNNSPYVDGWIARMALSNFKAERALLSDAIKAEEVFRTKIVEYRARCFKAFPDHEMVEVGVECSSVLAKLNELVADIQQGDVVHLVSDDPTAYVEMVRWSDETGNGLVEWRAEGVLLHFIIRKT